MKYQRVSVTSCELKTQDSSAAAERRARQFRNRSVFLSATLAAVLFSGVATAQRTAVNSGLVLNGVTIVDTHTGALTPGRAIAIDGGKIVKIGPAGSITVSGTAKSIDARGKFVVPGFWNMHAHVFDPDETRDNLYLMLANGITGFRQMSGTDEQLKARKDGTLMPANDAPELLAMPGSILTRANAATPEQAVAEVKKQKAEGADFIKTIDVTPETFFAANDEAKRQGLPYAGHLSIGVDAVKASEAGMSSIEHLGPMETLFISCSSAEPMIRQAIAARPAQPQLPANFDAKMLKLLVSNPILLRIQADPQFLSRLPLVLSTYDEGKCRATAKVFVEHNTWQCPTLIRERTAFYGDDPAYENDPNLKYVSPATRQLWAMLGKSFSEKVDPAGHEALKQFAAMFMTMTKLFDASGVKMLAGDDMTGIWVIPGFGLHQEFDLLSQAGLTPLTILQMTTINGAEFLNRTATAGTVEQGKDANLVLLDGNPIESVQNLHKINAVVRGGKYYSKDAIELLKRKVADHQASKAALTAPAEKAIP